MNLREKIDKFISFSLEQFGIKASWELIPIFSKEEWEKIAKDRARLMTIARSIDKEAFEKRAKIEYENGADTTFERNLKVLGMLFDIRLILKNKNIVEICEMLKTFSPFIFQFVEKNIGKDFLIFLNVPLILEEYNKDPTGSLEIELLYFVGHEIVHYVDNRKGYKRTFKQIGDLAINLIETFYKTEKLEKLEKKLKELLKNEQNLKTM